MKVSSVLGKGTTFAIVVPGVRVAEDGTSGTDRTTKTTGTDGTEGSKPASPTAQVPSVSASRFPPRQNMV